LFWAILAHHDHRERNNRCLRLAASLGTANFHSNLTTLAWTRVRASLFVRGRVNEFLEAAADIGLERDAIRVHSTSVTSQFREEADRGFMGDRIGSTPCLSFKEKISWL
jgi:hypothetical protein